MASKQESSLKKPKNLVVVVGPTAVGKTGLSIQIAERLNCEIISADSRQFYKEMEIGTAKPSDKELAAVKHHLINSLSIKEDYDVRDFEHDAMAIIESYFKTKDIMLVVGGSGLFVNALCFGLDDLPEVDPTVRESLMDELNANGLDQLQAELKLKDPVYYQQVDLYNPQRVVRALEVIRGTGKTFSEFRTGKRVKRGFNIIWVGLTMERQNLYERIDLRMDEMIEQGLFEEAARFYKHRHLNALQTVGYREIFGYVEGRYDKGETIRLLKRNSRRYAKRQLTWFNKNESIKWFSPTQLEEVLHHIIEESGSEFSKTKD